MVWCPLGAPSRELPAGVLVLVFEEYNQWGLVAVRPLGIAEAARIAVDRFMLGRTDDPCMTIGRGELFTVPRWYTLKG
jgi:hypothetical protein